MYYCETCHVMHKAKPYYETDCDYCGSKTITKLSKKTIIKIEHIDLSSTYQTLLNEFWITDNFEVTTRRYSRSRTAIFRNIGDNNHMKPYGFILDNIEDFKELSRTDLDNLWLKLFGKGYLKYYSFVYVRIKISLFDHFVLMPMSMTSIIKWFNDTNNELDYRIVYNKAIWCL